MPRRKVNRAPGRSEKRHRRTAEEARRAILDAAERRLSEAGPDSIRLQQIAADVGVSHPAILHHFESREALIRAVVRRAIERFETDLIDELGRAAGSDSPSAAGMIERAFDVLVEKGHARVVAWLLLSGHEMDPKSARVRTIAELSHARRMKRAPAGHAPSFEDTLFRTLLVALAVIGDAVAGEPMRAALGLGEDQDAPRRFREWLSGLVAGSGP
jgi:AcrR family transcriptional regulator